MPPRLESRRAEMTRNLTWLYYEATPENSQDGIAWYPLAQSIVRQFASHYRYHVDTVAAVVAAISPQCEWTRNLVIADDILAGRPPSIGGALHSCIRKAERLRDTDHKAELGETLSTRMREVFPHGPKVHAFAHNLAGIESLVTVDTHAMQAALGDVLSTMTLKPLTYSIIADCYMMAADEVSMTPATFQAIIWHAWKTQYPTKWKQKNRQQWSVISTE